MKRREFLMGASSAVLGCSISPVMAHNRRAAVQIPDNAPLIELDRFVREKMQRDHIPGVAACIVDQERILWAQTYGWADLDNRTPMSADGVQNVASISKTFTATAVMQLAEAGLVGLDKDVNDYLDFSIRHPKAAKQPITARQLLMHTSSIADGLAYSKLYACGDPRWSLASWLRQYFTPGGRYYDREQNFHPWLPDSNTYEYCNLAFGVLAHTVETVAGTPFAEYCRSNIFSPLGMRSTTWRIAEIDKERHVVPYTWVEEGKARGPSWGGAPLGVIERDGPTFETALEDGFHPNCVYSHPNYPDGFLRSSLNDLSRYVRAYLCGGAFEGYRLLRNESVDDMLTTQMRVEQRTRDGQSRRRSQGLTWSAGRQLADEWAWGHSGSDPGVNTDIRFLPSRGLGAIVLTNTNGIDVAEFTHRFLEVALKHELT